MLSAAVRFSVATAKELRIYKGYLLPKAPTRTTNAFPLYFSARKAQNSSLKLTEAAADWKKLSDAEKKPLIEKAQQSASEYKAKYEKYTQEYLNKVPSPPLTSFMLYSVEKYTSKPKEMSITRHAAEIGKSWKQLSEAEKKQYQEKSIAQAKALEGQADPLQKHKIPKDETKSAITLYHEWSKQSGEKTSWSEVDLKIRQKFEKEAEEQKKAYQAAVEKFCAANNTTVKEFEKLKKKIQKKKSEGAEGDKPAKTTATKKKSASTVTKKRTGSVKSAAKKTTKAAKDTVKKTKTVKPKAVKAQPEK